MLKPLEMPIHVQRLSLAPMHCYDQETRIYQHKGRPQLKKKRFLSGIARIMGAGGGLPMPKFFGPLFRSAFLVNKKSLFLQKCQCIELLTVVNISPSPLSSDFQILNFDFRKKEDQVAQIGVRSGGEGLGNSGNARKKTFFFY